MSTALVILTVCLPAAVFLLGLALTTIGLRGRRIDDHPLCRRCGFDLFRSGGSARCPECGNEISPARVRMGHRARRRRPLIAGLVLGIPSWLFLAVLCVAVVRGTDFEPYKPFWLLLHDGNARALAELNRREFVAKSLTSGQEWQLVSAGLAVQGDTNKPWLPGWGNLIEAMQLAGRVSNQDWQRYARQITSFYVKIRPVLRRGDVLPIRFYHGAFRSATNSRLRASIHLRKTQVDGVPFDIGGGGEVYISALQPANWIVQGTIDTTTDAMKPLADGKHQFAADMTVVMKDTSRSSGGGVVESWVEPQSLPLTLVAADAPTVEVVSDPSLRAKIENALSLQGGHGVPNVLDFNSGRFEGVVEARPLPIGVAFEVTARDSAGHEVKFNSIYFSNGENSGWGITGFVTDYLSDPVDLVLHASPDAARQTIGLTRIWGGDITFHHVKLIRPSTTTRPRWGWN